MKYRKVSLLIAEDEIIRLTEKCDNECIAECVENESNFSMSIISVSEIGTFDFHTRIFTPET